MGYYEDLDREIDKDLGWADPKSGGSERRQPGYWQKFLHTAKVTSPLWNFFKKIWRGFAKVAFFPIISNLGYSKRFNMDGDMVMVRRGWMGRIFDGIIARAILAPLIVGAFLLLVVYGNTHPQRTMATTTPQSLGIYFKRVNPLTVDGQLLSAWYIPPITEDQVAFDPESTLTQKWPGVVLCHGLGASHDQYLPLAQELHNAGFAVLMLDMRGQGESPSAAVTYGLRERLDVIAGVKYLRDMPCVDGTKIGVVGHDIAATAALQAAALDSSITAVVADGMWPKFDQRARGIFSQQMPGIGVSAQWMAPLYTLTFEIAVRERLSQLDPDAVVRSIRSQPLFFIARNGDAYAPVQEVMGLANNIPGPHEFAIADEKTSMDSHIQDFLIKTTGWKGPREEATDKVEQLLKKRVQ